MWLQFFEIGSEGYFVVIAVDLLLNTLPEPIVREIASGTSRIAHRYDHVTVLQADMVGFTPLSAARARGKLTPALPSRLARSNHRGC